MKRIFIFVPALLVAFTLPSHAADQEPCALQEKAARDAIGKPVFTEAEEYYQKCEVTGREQKKAGYVDTRDSWAASLNKLPNGGWELLNVTDDGTLAVFGSRRHATREGNVVSIWLRYEYREPQVHNEKSEVERDMYDCARVAARVVSITYYRENNLIGPGSSSIYDDKSTPWAPAIPGTMGDLLLDWACKTTPRPRAAKPQ